MKKSPTLLMKELKSIQLEIAQIHKADEEESVVPVDCYLKPRYEVGYSFEANRKRIKELQEREAQIHSILNVFNLTTKVNGYDLMVSEALVRLSQVRSEIKVLTPLAGQTQFFEPSYTRNHLRGDSTYKCCYDRNVVLEELKKLQKELASLQAAIDLTNLTHQVEC